MPHLDFFSYLLQNDTLFVNHAADPLIYAYRFPDELLFTFGTECEGINRNYSSSSKFTDDLAEDMKKVGINTQIFNCNELNMFFRVYLKGGISNPFGLQIYDNRSYDLLADMELPKFFKLLGYREPYLYGITMFPEETDDQTNYTVYKLKVSR
jgi:hypothetical protein